MKVTIEHVEAKVGMFKKAPAIRLTVLFSDVEKAIIKKHGLAERWFYEAPKHSLFSEDMQGPTYVRTILPGKPCTIHYVDLATARNEEQKIYAGLKNIKEAINDFSAPVEQTKTFEL
jgi:hypothetical protein